MEELPRLPAPQARRASAVRRYRHFWGPRPEDDVDEEMRFHLDMRIRDYAARGLGEADARDAASRRLGDLAAIRTECLTIAQRRERRMTRALLIDAFVQDARYACRTLVRHRAWAAVAVATLAIGIGATTAVFSAVSSLLLHPLPYPHAGRVVIIYQEPSEGNQTGVRVMITPQADVVRAWREGSRAFEDIENYTATDATLQVPGETPSVVHAASVLASFPQFAGQRPIIGRMFSESERASGDRVAVLGESLWRSRYGSQDVVGRTVTLDDSLYTIIGVMPAALQLPRLAESTTDVWLPLNLTRRGIGLWGVGRLREGATLQAAARELDSLTSRVTSVGHAGMRFRTRLVPPREIVEWHDSLLLLTGAVAMVLLISCANVAHLLLARAVVRQREMAVRTALGAGGLRLSRQLVTECLVLAALGCAGGVALGWAGLRVFVALRPATLDELASARMDAATLWVALALSALTGVLFGLVGAHASRRSSHEALKAGATNLTQGRQHHRLRSLLVVSEMAISATLLVGATLLVRSVVHLQLTDPGFDVRGLYGVRVSLPRSRYPAAGPRAGFYAELARRAGALPGVRGVTLAAGSPGTSNFLIGALQVDDEPTPGPGITSFVDYNAIEPNYFAVTGQRLVQGTTFTDSSATSGQVVVNEGLARRRWRNASALGHRVRVALNGQGEWRTVVGVAADARMGGLTTESSKPMLYLPRNDGSQLQLIVRTSSETTILPALRHLVGEIDPHLPPPEIVGAARVMASSVAGPRFTMILLTIFTLLAVLLAAVGLYGVMAYAVAQRVREIGIRIALGATRRAIAGDVAATGLAISVTGGSLGLLGGWWAARFLDRMLYGVSRTDIMSFIVGGGVLFGASLLACLVPMSRAAGVDPAIAMRAE